MKSLIKMLLMSVVMIAGNCFAQFSQTQGNYSQSILNGYLVNETGLAYSNPTLWMFPLLKRVEYQRKLLSVP